MRTVLNAKLIPCALLMLLVLAPLSSVSARSVHETSTVDLLPQGHFQDASVWALDAYTSFSQEPASYTESMVADSRLTMIHDRPVNLDQMIFWAQSTPTNSNNSLYAPDGGIFVVIRSGNGVDKFLCIWFDTIRNCSRKFGVCFCSASRTLEGLCALLR